MNRTDTISSLVQSAHRLGRIAALATGNTAPVAHWRTLAVLESEGPLRVGELAAACRVTQPGMTRLLATLVEVEHVTRVADTADSRAWLIQLSPKGRAALDEWRGELGEALTPWFDGLDDADWAALDRAADILATRTTASPEKVTA
ncbi:MarR family winged helix-turn-helix transcriptional regulator [Schumannella soli]|uniref:MarR family transcriptional regulator n=1 Tax=Schumannella soli TaxID=2590779 RepID=A0A506Y0X6_9MICO|nr:MarR family transcriptional regulator [Schumannella soli]TPW74598.1 MarR family transcriptional regulator [Schumannella soli]